MEEVLEPLIGAAVNWLALGLPVKTLKIVEYSEPKALKMRDAFVAIKQKYDAPSPLPEPGKSFKYDYFISYSLAINSQLTYL